jgi:hypothetical protein
VKSEGIEWTKEGLVHSVRREARSNLNPLSLRERARGEGRVSPLTPYPLLLTDS